MTRTQWEQGMGMLEENLISQAAPQAKSGHSLCKKKRLLWGAAAACFVLAACSLPFLFRQAPSLSFTRSEGVTAVYVEEPAEQTLSTSDLPWLTEEQLLNGQPTYVFQGTVVGLQNLCLDFNGLLEYRALATIQVEKAYLTGSNGRCRT